MGKEDFAAGFLQGLYNAGVGNPDVRRQKEQQNIETAFKQQEMDARMASEGMVRPQQQDQMHSKIGDFVKNLFGVNQPKTLQTAYQPDPNAQFEYLGADNQISSTETPGSTRISPNQAREVRIALAKQRPSAPKERAVNIQPMQQKNKITEIVKPQSKKEGKPGSSPEETLQLYETARKGLLSGLSGTKTGYLYGKLPAITAKQQIATGAVAAMAPVLKQLFRVSGEGVFTDKDQQLLLDMIPTRGTDPEAIQPQIENIDLIVKAKLGMGVSTNPDQEAINWAKSNPSDPRSKEILKLHGL